MAGSCTEYVYVMLQIAGSLVNFAKLKVFFGWPIVYSWIAKGPELVILADERQDEEIRISKSTDAEIFGRFASYTV